MTRIKQGWRLTKDSWAILKADRSLALFPLLSLVFSVIAFVLLIAPGVGVAVASEQEWPLVPFFLIASYAATFAAIYFNVALAGATVQSMAGKDTKLADGLAVARERRGLIARWALVQWAVGLIINLLQSALGDSPAGRIIGGIVSVVLSASWAIATFFVIPVLAFEQLSPGDALKRSASIVRERWGEGLVGSASIGFAVFLVAVIPVGGFAAIAFATASTAPAVAVAAGAVAAIALIAAGVVGSALNVIFRVALYRFATEGKSAPGFADSDLDNAFRGKRRRFGRA